MSARANEPAVGTGPGAGRSLSRVAILAIFRTRVRWLHADRPAPRSPNISTVFPRRPISLDSLRAALVSSAGRVRQPLATTARVLLTKRVYLALLFVGAVAVSWAARWSRVENTTVPVLTEGVSVLPVLRPTDSEPSAPRRSSSILDEVSDVWSAPPLPTRSAVREGDGGGGIAPSRTPAAEVDRWIQRLSGDLRGDTRLALERLGTYEPLLHHALRERGLPTELVYLALIESGYSPRATSRSGAAGIWQFMPETARSHGLEVSDYVDERRDPIRSTFAAIRHLEWLHRQFGSWHLAAAAYNAGDGRVGRLLRDLLGSRGGDETLYWRVRSFLPAETSDYVPKLLAAARIARAPHRYGFGDVVAREPLRFREWYVEGGTPLADVAERLAVSPESLYELNPHLIRRTTPPGRRWPVRVPAELPGLP
jgi:hypothetical protein